MLYDGTPADMTSPPENRSARRQHRARPFTVAALALGIAAWIGACSTVETQNFSDGDCVAGGCQQASGSSSSGASSSSSSSGQCTVDQSCAVKWSTDIFANILDTQAAGCTAASLCHGDGKGNLTLTPGDAHGAYVALAAWTMAKDPQMGKAYIAPCDPTGSGMLCNMKAESGSTNAYGECGSLMPLVGTSLTMDQLNTIADWIACGAPEN